MDRRLIIIRVRKNLKVTKKIELIVIFQNDALSEIFAMMDTPKNIFDLISNNNVDALRNLLKNNPDVLETHDGNFWPFPIHAACQKGSLDVIKVILDFRPEELYKKMENENAPVHHACRNVNAIEILNYLIKVKGADVNANDGYFRTPLHLACMHEDFELVKYFIGIQGVDVNAKDMSSNTPLHFACSECNFEIVKYLVEVGNALINVKNYDNETCLRYFLYSRKREENDYKIAKYLIEKGVDYEELLDDFPILEELVQQIDSDNIKG